MNMVWPEEDKKRFEAHLMALAGSESLEDRLRYIVMDWDMGSAITDDAWGKKKVERILAELKKAKVTL